uniref:Apolipoprotein L3 n=1 Tax=Loxodonta africana TaxID=9785 RepID=G3TKC8_LOXAF
RSTPKSQGFIEEVIEYLENSLRQEELQLLLAEDQAWERFLNKAGLSRVEDIPSQQSMRDISSMPFTDIQSPLMNRKLNDSWQERTNVLLGHCLVWSIHVTQGKGTGCAGTDPFKKDIERFLDEFPWVKMELEEHIEELHRIVDNSEREHRDCTIFQVVASFTGIFSSILGLLGLALAPATTGASLALPAAVGLGTVAAITSVSTSFMESSAESSAIAKASKLMSTDVCEGIVKPRLPSVPITEISMEVLANIGRAILDIRLGNPQPVANARHLVKTGAQVMGRASRDVFLPLGAVNLVKDSKHLYEGAKQSAEEIRMHTWELEGKLEELTQIYKSLVG